MTITETERLIIRHINPKDLYVLLKIYNKQENMQFISSGKCSWTMDELSEKYSKTNNNYNSGYGIYVVELKETGEVIGETGLFNSFNDTDKLELGYIIDSLYWGKGFGRECCTALIDYAFQKLNVNTLIARMYAKNESSVILSEKCGMKRVEEGVTEKGKSYYVYVINQNDI